VEAEFGITLDMEKMDAEQLTILSAFSKYVAENSAASPVAANGKAVEMNELNADGIRSDLRNFIRRSYSIAENDQDFTDDVHLYNAGYIDPMGSAGLKSFVESKFAIRVNDMDLSKYSMNTIRELSEFVMKRRKGEI
jgi:D-alanine--poly(phosphoribitol) ligase subunit 2